MSKLPPAQGRMAQVLNEIGQRDSKAHDALVEHLLGGTSAEWLAKTLTSNGHRIGATTIKSYRRDIAASAERSV